MPKLKTKTPSHRLHKGSGQAVVTLSGKGIYLGIHGTEESHAEYRRVIAGWLQSNQRTLAPVRWEEVQCRDRDQISRQESVFDSRHGFHD